MTIEAIPEEGRSGLKLNEGGFLVDYIVVETGSRQALSEVKCEVKAGEESCELSYSS